MNLIYNILMTSFFLPSQHTLIAPTDLLQKEGSMNRGLPGWSFNDTAHLQQERLAKFAKLNLGNSKL